jgi:cytochrome bd-type quinol oxidase subunit 1
MILLFSFLWGLALFLGAEEALAELPDYTPLVNLPGIQEGSTSIPAFINRVYIFTIVIGALLGVVKIALAGAKYSMGDVITNKEEAKKDIMGVLLGLVVLLAPWIVLNTIYPGLLNLDFTKNITNVGIQVEPSP